jgi:hypothetical protein
MVRLLALRRAAEGEKRGFGDETADKNFILWREGVARHGEVYRF